MKGSITVINDALNDKMKIHNNKYNQNYRENKHKFTVFSLNHILSLSTYAQGKSAASAINPYNYTNILRTEMKTISFNPKTI